MRPEARLTRWLRLKLWHNKHPLADPLLPCMLDTNEYSALQPYHGEIVGEAAKKSYRFRPSESMPCHDRMSAGSGSRRARKDFSGERIGSVRRVLIQRN